MYSVQRICAIIFLGFILQCEVAAMGSRCDLQTGPDTRPPVEAFIGTDAVGLRFVVHHKVARNITSAQNDNPDAYFTLGIFVVVDGRDVISLRW